MEKKDDLAALERIIGYHFFEQQHLIRALTHPAYANEVIQKNRICLTQDAYSTLGDAVLKTSLILFLMEKGLQEKGAITRAKEQLEDNATLARIGHRMKIKRFIRLGRGEKDLWKSGEETILADTMEAIIGAIYLDSDASLGVVRQCIGIWFEPELVRVRREDIPQRKVRSPPSSTSRRARPR
ncbi:ribonuclease III domain-containing protein [Methanoregula sp.]|uniref:ribonuclease III domain-containing protein n=1 Tax=Methanoregula sp. TaxID=2052170 RepID=UPI002C76C813|nr:ribonuclease III domain-containing protein [Methanoregula sp.]HVP97480.1 ribonuclease III domain-containing protein [Methanoregula sp.]